MTAPKPAFIVVSAQPARPEGGYIVGDLVRLTARLTDPASGQLVESTGVCTILDPAGATHTPTIIYSATLVTADGVAGPGHYVDVDVELAAGWHFRFAFTGAYQAADDGKLLVDPSPVA